MTYFAVLERYFAFGANLNPATLERRRVRPRSARPARLDGHRLVFDLPGIPWVEPAFASVRPADDHVWGVVYEVGARDLGRLRAYESARYDEIGVTVQAPDGPVEARTFANREPRRERAPSARYLGVIIEGARHHGLPDAWIARLEAHPRRHVPLLGGVWDAGFALVELVHRVTSVPARRK